MAEEKSRGEAKLKKSAPKDVTFKCQMCEKQKPISEMKAVKRFRPVIIVCQDCEKVMQ